MSSESEDLYKELIHHDSALTQRREPWIPLWRTLADYFLPTRQYYGPDHAGSSKEPKALYNSRGVRSLEKSQAMFQAYTANMKDTWFKLIFTDTDLIKYPGVADWLEDVENIGYRVLLRSGFYNAQGDYAPDIHAIGTGIMYMEEGKQPGTMVYQVRHPRAVTIAENDEGKVDTIFEDAFMTAKAAKQRFEKNLTERLARAEETNPYLDVTIKHSVFPMDERYRKYALKDFDPDMPFVSVWWDKQDRQKNNGILDVRGYWEFPYIAGRRAQSSGEEYGRSEAMNALYDAKVGNSVGKSTLLLAQKIADPTYIVHEDLEGNDNDLNVAGGRVYVTDDDRRVEPVPLGANYPITLDYAKHIDEIIDDHLHLPFYAMLQTIEPGKMTATETMERMGEQAAGLGYLTGRHHTEFLQPVIKNTVNTLLRTGQLPTPPRIVQDAIKAGIGLDITFLGKLSQIQSRYFKTDGINASMGFISGAVQMFGPEALDNVDQDEFMREGLTSLGTPQKIIREMPDVEERRKQRAEAIAAQQAKAEQFQNQQAIIQNANKLGQKPQAGSPLAEMETAV